MDLPLAPAPGRVLDGAFDDSGWNEYHYFRRGEGKSFVALTIPLIQLRVQSQKRRVGKIKNLFTTK